MVSLVLYSYAHKLVTLLTFEPIIWLNIQIHTKCDRGTKGAAEAHFPTPVAPVQLLCPCAAGVLLQGWCNSPGRSPAGPSLPPWAADHSMAVWGNPLSHLLTYSDAVVLCMNLHEAQSLVTCRALYERNLEVLSCITGCW